VQKLTTRLWLLTLWTLVVWGGRVRNILSDPVLSTPEQAWRLGLAILFVALAAIGLLVLVGWKNTHPTFVQRFAAGFSLWTMALWIVRGGGILFATHDAAFKIVHTVLALGSIGLALLVYQAERQLAASAR
jgi:uncharacterized membrane protein